MNNYVRKIFKIVICCIYLFFDGYYGFIGDFFILISGDFGYVGGIVNFSVVLLCLVDMLIGLVL